MRVELELVLALQDEEAALTDRRLEAVVAFWQQELTKQRASFSALEAQKTDAELRMMAMSDEIEQLKTIVEGRALRDRTAFLSNIWAEDTEN